ncbi:MAG TPA: hypothetical protein VJX66_04925, partial [Amycolatopsis sp.]|nr:hypothetical protein [Amycolatopsis sp.]
MPGQEFAVTEARPDHADARVRSTSRFPRPAVGRLIAWQVLLLCVVISLAEHDGVRWVATATASLIFLLTLVRVRFRWLYQWVPTIVRFLHGRRSGGLGRLLAGLTFATTSEGRGTPAVGVVHDGAAWMSMVAVESVDVLGTDPASLPLGRITELLDPDGGGPVAVQVLVRM